MKAWRDDLIAIGFLITVFAVWFGPAVSGGNLAISGEDVIDKFFAMRTDLYNVAHQYGWSLWNPLPGLGEPRLGNMEYAAFAPVSLLFYTLPPRLIFPIYPFLVYSLVALFTYAMLRTRDVETLPSVFGALSWSACGALMGHLPHPPVLETLLWLPATLASWNLWIRRSEPIWLVSAAITLTFQCFGASPQYIFYNGLLIVVWVLCDLWNVRNDGAILLHRMAGAAVFTVGGYLLAAWQILPALEYAQHAQRNLLDSSQFADQFRAAPWEVVLALVGEVHWMWRVPPMTYGYPYPNRPCLSLLTTFLSLVPLWPDRQRRDVPWGVGVAIVLFLVGMLGTSGGITPLLNTLFPFARQFRAPSRMIVPASLLISWIAACGLQQLMRRLSTRNAAWLCVGAITYLAASLWSFTHGEIRFVAADEFQVPADLHGIRPRAAWNIQRSTPPPFYINALLVAGVSTLSTIETQVPAAYFEGMYASQIGPLTDVQKISVLISNSNLIPILHPERSLLRSYGLASFLCFKQDSIEIRKLAALPHAWVASSQRLASTPEERWSLAASDTWDPAATAIVDHQLDVQSDTNRPNAKHVEMEKNTADYQRMRVDSRGGILVVSDLMYPGWTATVDRRQAEAVTVNIALRGVVVPPGQHTVEWAYRPRWVPLANGCTIAGVLVVMLGGCLLRHKRSANLRG